MIQAEHILQRHAKLFVRDAVTAEHELFAFDAARKSSVMAWAKEKARGVRTSTPDVLLRVKGIAPIWTEWKAPGVKITDDGQKAMGARLMELGDWWSWCNDIETYAMWLDTLGVEMRSSWPTLAALHQAAALDLIAKARLKAGVAPKSYKPRAAKVARGRMSSVESVRSRVLF